MSNRYYGGMLSATKIITTGEDYTGSAGGIWNVVQQARAKKLTLWPKGQGVREPLDPTVTSIVPNNEYITVFFSPPTDTGGLPITKYTATVNPGNHIYEVTTSPINVYDLSNSQTYVVSVTASNSYGTCLNYTNYTVTPSLQDPYWNNITLLLRGEGTNGSTTFTDESTFNNTMSVAGTDVTISTTKSKYGTSSISYTGTGNLTTPAVSTNLIGLNNDFTVEFWMYPNQPQPGWAGLCGNYLDASYGSRSSWNIGYNSAGTSISASVATSNGVGLGTSYVAITPIVWSHIAFVRYGSTFTLYVNGVASSSFTYSGAIYDGGSNFELGAIVNGGARFSGYLDEIRITKGVARYTSTFFPPFSHMMSSLILPSKPTNVTATIGAGQSVISFTASTTQGGTAITGYKVVSIPDGITATGPSSPITIIDLNNGTNYSFRVFAINAAGGVSAPSNPSNIVQPNPPMLPSSPTITNAVYGNASATIYFTLSTNLGGSTILRYTVTSSPGNLTATGLTSPITITGLTNGTEYTFTMTSTNKAGNSAVSNTSDPILPCTIPDTPSITNVVAGDAAATISFAAAANNGGTAVTNFTVTSSPGNISNTGLSSPIVISGLTNGVSYTFTITATNKEGTSLASAASASALPMPPVPLPPVLYATAITSTAAQQSFVLNWDTNPSCTYTVWGPSGLVTGVSTSGSTITTQGGSVALEPGQSYNFYVIATNLSGTATSANLLVAIPNAVVNLYVSGTTSPLTVNNAWAVNQGWTSAQQAKPSNVTIFITGRCVSQLDKYTAPLDPWRNLLYTIYTLSIMLTGLHASSTIQINVGAEICGMLPDYASFNNAGKWVKNGFNGGPALYIACDKNVTIYNYNNIFGAGGGGGIGADGYNAPLMAWGAGNGGNGGDGIVLQSGYTATIYNYGTIAGGGGGGGGGGSGRDSYVSPWLGTYANGSTGGDGTVGGGGAAGGTGGIWGTNGNPGATGTFGGGGAGGTAGRYIVNGSGVTWAVTGTRIGTAA